MKIALIGGSGFIGTRLVKRLLEENHQIDIIDKAKSKTYPQLSKKADVRDLESLRTTLRNDHEVIYNLAAEHKDDVRPISLYDEVNVDGAKNVCQVASEKGIQRIIFTSSVAVYGFAPPGTDETGEINYFNDYGRTKWLAEEEYRQWRDEDPSTRNLVIVRPTVVFGEGNRGNVYTLLNQITKKKFIMVGNGKNKKSMAYVENVAAFLEWCITLGKGYHLHNYVDKPDYDMDTLVQDVKNILGIHGRPILKLPYTLGIIAGYKADSLPRLSRKPFSVSAVRIRIFCSNKALEQRIPSNQLISPHILREGFKKTIPHYTQNNNEHIHA